MYYTREQGHRHQIKGRECRVFAHSSSVIWCSLWAGYCAGSQELTSHQNPKLPACATPLLVGDTNKPVKTTRKRNCDKDLGKQGVDVANSTYVGHSFLLHQALAYWVGMWLDKLHKIIPARQGLKTQLEMDKIARI